MSPTETVQNIKAKALRMHAMAQIVETFDTADERRDFLVGMVSICAISEQAADLLMEAFGLEKA